MQSFVVKAPTRADLAGGTLDLWPLYCFVEGARTVNVALDLYAKASFRSQPDTHFSFELSNGKSAPLLLDRLVKREELDALPHEYRFAAFVVSQYLREREELPMMRLDIHWDTSVPVGSGLGGSSTLCVVLARGISRIFGDYIEQGWQWKMLEWVRDVEAAFLGMPTGTQDYLAALFGGLRSYSSSLGGHDELAYSSSVLDRLGQRMLILFSGEQHNSGLSNWEIYKKAIEGDVATMSGLRGIAQIANDLDNELRSGNLDLAWPSIGQLLSEEWKIRKELFGVHTPRLEAMVDFLMSQKVLGVKVCGAAQGGSLLALVAPEQRDKVAELCRGKGITVLSTQPVRRGVHVDTLSV